MKVSFVALSSLLLFQPWNQVCGAEQPRQKRSGATRSHVRSEDANNRFLVDVVNAVGCVPTPSHAAMCETDGPKPFCIPHRSPDQCTEDVSFPALIKKRTQFIKSHDVGADGWWFPELEDKVASYFYAARRGFNPPKMMFCSSNVPAGLDDFNSPDGGIVIRVTHSHSSKGVYVFPDGLDGIELIRGITMSIADIKTDMVEIGATHFVIEEYVHGKTKDELPVEFKFHMFNGKVGSINILSGSGTDCGCWAEIDADGTRLDLFGCFTPSFLNHQQDTCLKEEYIQLGANNAHPVKGVGLCSTTPNIDQRVLNHMIDLAKLVSSDIGAYVRVDMFVGGDGRVYLQELSTNHLNGLRHCSAKRGENGCIDTCFLGKMWKAEYGDEVMGGIKKDIPAFLSSFLAESDKCAAALAVELTVGQSSVTSSGEESTAPSSTPSGGQSSFSFDRPSLVPPESTSDPLSIPFDSPSLVPPESTSAPSSMPSDRPSLVPKEITSAPSPMTFDGPSLVPPESISAPFSMPFDSPSLVPPESTPAPVSMPSDHPSLEITSAPSPTFDGPSLVPLESISAPFSMPFDSPSLVPPESTSAPSSMPSDRPSLVPKEITSAPSPMPSDGPSLLPMERTSAPSPMPSDRPSLLPTEHTTIPSLMPSDGPSLLPTESTSAPSPMISDGPSLLPTESPSAPSPMPSQSSPLPSSNPTSTDPCRSDENVLIFLGADEVTSFNKDTLNVSWVESAVYNINDDQFYFCGNETFDVFVALDDFNFTGGNYTHQQLLGLSKNTNGMLRHYETAEHGIVITDIPGGTLVNVLVTTKVVVEEENIELYSFNRQGSVLNISSASPEIRAGFKRITNIPEVTDRFSVNVTENIACFKTMKGGIMPPEVVRLEKDEMIFAFDDDDDAVMARLVSINSAVENATFIQWSIERVSMEDIFAELDLCVVASGGREEEDLPVGDERRRLLIGISIGTVVKVVVREGYKVAARAFKAFAKKVAEIDIEAELNKEVDLISLDLVEGQRCNFEKEFNDQAKTAKLTIKSQITVGFRAFANAKVTMEAKLSLRKGLKKANLKLESKAGATMFAELGASANLEHELRKRVFEGKKTRKIIVVGQVPVLLAYQPTVDLGFKSSLNLEVAASMKMTSSVSMELQFSFDKKRDEGKRFQTESKWERKWEIERPEISGRAAFEVELGPTFSFNVWFYELIQGSMALDTLVIAKGEVGTNLNAIVIAPPYYTINEFGVGLRFRLSAQAGFNTELAKAIAKTVEGGKKGKEEEKCKEFVEFSSSSDIKDLFQTLQSFNTSDPLANVKSFVAGKALSSFGSGLNQDDQLSKAKGILSGGKNNKELSQDLAAVVLNTDTFNQSVKFKGLKASEANIGSVQLFSVPFDVALLSIPKITIMAAGMENETFCQGDDAIVVKIGAGYKEQGFFFKGVNGQQWYTDLDGRLLEESTPWKTKSTTDKTLTLHLPRTATNMSYTLPLNGTVYLRATPQLLPFATNSLYASKSMEEVFKKFGKKDFKFDCCDDSDCLRKPAFSTTSPNQIYRCQENKCMLDFISAAPSVTPGSPTGAPSTTMPSTSPRPSLRPSNRASASPSIAATCPSMEDFLKDKAFCEAPGLTCAYKYEDVDRITRRTCTVRDSCTCQVSTFNCDSKKSECRDAPTPAPTTQCPAGNTAGYNSLQGSVPCTGSNTCDFLLDQFIQPKDGATCNPTGQCTCRSGQWICADKRNCQDAPLICNITFTEACVSDVSDGIGFEGIEISSMKFNGIEALTKEFQTDVNGDCVSLDVTLDKEKRTRQVTFATEERDENIFGTTSFDKHKFSFDVKSSNPNAKTGCPPGSYVTPQRGTGDGQWKISYTLF